jgi:hypothetical protein
MEFILSDNLGVPLAATVEIEPASIVLHSRGGTKGSVGSRNQDYAAGLRLMLQRLMDHRLQIVGAWVDSSRVRHLSLEDRQILYPRDLPTTSAELFTLVSKRMETVGQTEVAERTKGNRNKRIRFSLSAGSVGEIAAVICALPKDSVPRHALRLPNSDLRLVTPEHVWMAITSMQSEGSTDSFHSSRDYDLLTSTGQRLPPKAVFGRAATIALGFSVGPEHFTGGLGTPCFDILIQAGYSIVPKNQIQGDPDLLSADEKVWSEGHPRLVTHIKRERGRGLAAAKKAAFIREHGKLFCERCDMDPFNVFGDMDGYACIEVHHKDTTVSQMNSGHQTRLEDLQCLCANCHRYLHRTMKTVDLDTKRNA